MNLKNIFTQFLLSASLIKTKDAWYEIFKPIINGTWRHETWPVFKSATNQKAVTGDLLAYLIRSIHQIKIIDQRYKNDNFTPYRADHLSAR